MTNKNFEMDLIKAIQPIRFYVLATVIHHLIEQGIYDFIYSEFVDLDDIVEHCSLERERLIGFLSYCANENIIILENNQICLTDYGKTFSRFRGWYKMLIGGYGHTFLQLGSCLTLNSEYASREGESVGIGSCAISQYDALPLTQNLLSRSQKSYHLALDIGCGNAQYLIEFCRYFQDINAIGIEPDVDSFIAAKKLVKNANLSQRITLYNQSASDFLNETDCKPDVMVISFVLHELLGQIGRENLKKFLCSIILKYPEIDIVVIEVNDQINSPEIMRHELALAYYNPYYLLHYFTNQKLETDIFWENLFNECRLEIVGKDYVNKNIDSTHLEIGYLLRAKNE